MLSGVVGSEDVSLTGTPGAALKPGRSAPARLLNVTGYSLGGADAGNYTLTPLALTADITARDVNVTGVSADNKTYDGTTAATLTGTPALSGVVGGDAVNLEVAAASFATKTVGTSKPVNGGFSISGSDIGNYNLIQPSLFADITARDLTASATGVDKQYDGDATATVILSTNKLGGDTVNPTYASAAFVNKNVGNGKIVNVTGIFISGADAANYNLTSTAATTTANISPKALTITGLTANNKVYNGASGATLSGIAALSGVIDTEDVSLAGSPTAVFGDEIVGDGKTVTVSGYTLAGAEAGNYTLTSLSLTANITPKGLTITGVTVGNRTYNGTIAATLGGTPALSGIVPGDTVTLGGTPSAEFGDKHVGTAKPVTVSGYSISGADAANYGLSQPTGLTANITAASVTPHITAADKVYDGTTAAALLTRTLTGVFGSDDVTLTGGSATFADAAVGSGKTVTATGLSLSGADIANYSLSSTSATTTASINGSISGSVGIEGATVSFTGGTPVTSGPGGSYTIVVPPNWTGSVTPSMTGYYFTPDHRAYTNFSAVVTGENYTATHINYTIQGSAGIGGATLTYTDGTEKTVTADISGVYILEVSYGWSGTVTPSKSGYAFNPLSKTYTNVTSNQTNQNYSATFTAITYYVNKNNSSCSDSGPGTLATPFCTIGHGAFVATAGNKVWVVAGDYPERVKPNANGSAGNPITFHGEPGVIVRGDGSATGNAFRITGFSYITVEGFTVRDTTDYGIYVESSNHIIISGNTVTSAGDPAATPAVLRSGIHLFSATNSSIIGNTSYENSDHGIEVVGASSNVTVENNTVYGNANEVARIANGIIIQGTSTNISVIHNTAYNNEDTGIGVNGDSHDNFIIGNLSYGNGDHGIDISGSRNNAVVGNTVQGNVTVGINLEDLDATHDASGATVENNICIDNGTNPPTGLPGNIRVADKSRTGTTVDYNLVYQTDAADVQYIWITTSYTTLGGFQGASGQEAHGMQANPWLNSVAPVAVRPTDHGGHPVYAVGPFHYNLTAASPAIDSANSLAPHETIADIDGKPRVDIPATGNTGIGPRAYDDRGAYELQPATVTLDGLSQTYDGSPKPVTATTNPAGMAVTVTYAGSGTAPTNANSYAVVASITEVGYTGSSNGTLVIAPKALTISGVTVGDKTYDFNTTAVLGGTPALVGVVGGDTVNLGGSAVATFADKNVGTGKPVTASGYSISGGSAGNYTLSQPVGLTANIIAKGLSISGLTAANKTYDGNTTAALTGTPVLVGVIGSEVVTLGGTPTAVFDTKNIGIAKPVTVIGYTLGGTDLGNYGLSQPAGLVANIDAKGLTINGVTANNKPYDGTAVATLTGVPVPVGVIGSETVTIAGTPTAAFDTKNIGTGKTVTVVGYILGGQVQAITLSSVSRSA